MNKKWIGIIIILFLGLIAMYLIVDSSNSVGNSITVIGDMAITLPPHFKTGESSGPMASMSNSEGNIIFINYLKKGGSSLKYYKNNLTSLESNPDITVLNSTSNGTVHTINYINPNSKYENPNETLVFFEKDNRVLSLRLVCYDNFKEQNEDISFIIDNAKHDFKQNKAQPDFEQFTI